MQRIMNTNHTLRIGLASECITPSEPVWLYGYATEKRYRPFEGIAHDLHAKALAVEDARGHRAVLVTADLCVMRKPLADRVVTRIARRTGLPPEDILVNLSHTHSGPMIGEEDPRRWPLPPEMRERIGRYTDTLVERLAEAASGALADARPAGLAWGRGRVGFVRNRRVFDAQGNYRGMGPNPDGFTDPRVTVLRVDHPDGTLRALIGSLACHAVTLNQDNPRLCGDYPGFAQAALEARHPGLTALFVQGCGADANSHPRATPDQMDWAERQGEALAREIERVAAGELRPIRGPLHTARVMLDLPLRRRSRPELEAAVDGPESGAHNPRRILELLDRGETPAATHAAPVSVWRWADDLTLVGLPGETVSGYIPRMEQVFGPERLWVAGYCNEVFGYLPTSRIVREGGYEDRGLVYEIGQFDAAVEETVVDGVRRLARSLPESHGYRRQDTLV